MNKYDLMHAFKSILYVANDYGMEIDEKYEELHEKLIEDYDLSVSDMMGSLENIYQLLSKEESD